MTRLNNLKLSELKEHFNIYGTYKQICQRGCVSKTANANHTWNKNRSRGNEKKTNEETTAVRGIRTVPEKKLNLVATLFQ